MATINGYKNGKKIDIFVRNDKAYKKCKEHKTLDPTRIIGVDTESLRNGDDNEDLRTLSVQCHTYKESYVQDTRDLDTPITACFDMLWNEYSTSDIEPFNNTQRKKRKRELPHDKRSHRDGRVNTIPPILWVFYNLEYDFGRLYQKNVQMIRTITANLDSVRIQVDNYEIEIVSQLVTGSCPSFEYFVRKEGRIMRILGMDIGAYWKGGLNKTAQAILKGEGKVNMSKEVFHLSLQLFDALPQEDKDLFWQYASEDARLTRDIYLATVDLLVQVEPLVIKRNGVIPASAPGASAKIAFSWGSENEWLLPPTYIHQAGMNAYAGARVFNRKSQYVEDIMVLDIVSAYPHVMTLLPDPCTCSYPLVKQHTFTLEAFKGQWGVVKIKGEGLDPLYPALRMHDEQNCRLRYIYGKFDELWTTIPEMVIGVVSGRLRVDHIYTGFFIEGDNTESFLRKFVLEMFRIKDESEKNSPMYLLSKLLMNSLYGKLVEVKLANVTSIQDECASSLVLKVPDIEDKKQELFTAYAQYGENGLLELFEEWSEQYPDVSEAIHFFELLGETHEGKAGYYFLPMHGAQITGFVSAKLGLAAHCTEALQGDTDSIFVEDAIGLDEYEYLMQKAGYDCPSEGLGAFEVDIDHASGYLVKNKMYALTYTQDGQKKYKIATHGITGLKLEDNEKHLDKAIESYRLKQKYFDLIERVCLTGKSVYNATQVRKLKQAYNTQKMPGVFFDLEREISCVSDPNQELNEHGEKVWKRLQ